MVQDNRALSQQVENLRARQTLDQTSLQELKERVDEKLDQSVQPVTFSAPIYYYSEALQASAVGVLEGQPALDDLGNQPGTALYPESQESGTRIHTDTGDLDSILNASAETLLNIPKTLDTSFESK